SGVGAPLRLGVDGCFCVLAGSSDRGCGASDQRLQGKIELAILGRLMVDARLAPVVTENRWCDLAAGVAIDTGVIDEEGAGNVLRQPPRKLGHQISLAAKNTKFLCSFTFLRFCGYNFTTSFP